MNQSFGLGAAALVLGAALLACPEAAAQGFGEGLRLCGGSLLPALFPFFVVCELLMASPLIRWLGAPLCPLARRYGLRGRRSVAVLLLGWVGGYAVCARLVARLRGEGVLSRREGSLLLALGCCSGPGFVVGCVGGQLLGSVALGTLLYGIQLAANLIAAACLARIWRPDPGEALPAEESPRDPVTLPGAIGRAVDSSLTVCGCVLFFRVVYRLAAALPWWAGHEGALPFLSGCLEISAGCADFAAAGSLPGVCFCLSVLGLSVFAQLAALLDGCVPLGPLAAARVIHLVVMQLLIRLALRSLPGEAEVFSSLAPRVVVLRREAPDTALAVFFFLCAALYQLYKSRQSPYNKDK